MNIRGVLLAASLAAVPVSAFADQINGLYMTIGGGINRHSNQSSLTGVTPSLGISLPATAPQNEFGNGLTVLGAVGYGFGNGMRAEVEGAYRQNAVLRNRNPGILYDGNNERKYTLMLNGILDVDVGLPVKPFIGAGGGLAIVSWNPVNRTTNGLVNCCIANGLSPDPRIGLNYGSTPIDVSNLTKDSDVTYAVQLMAGVTYDIPWVQGLSFGAQYRFLMLPHNIKFENVLTIVPQAGFPPGPGRQTGVGHTTYSSHTSSELIFTLTYAFDTAPAPVPVAAVPASPGAKSYIVFFDWDKAILTARAKQIVAEAAQASTKAKTTKLEVDGHADTSGAPGYNRGLSERRAQVVAADLVRDGVPKENIFINSFGDTRPLVPTGPGVREPQNRRVEIVLK